MQVRGYISVLVITVFLGFGYFYQQNSFLESETRESVTEYPQWTNDGKSNNCLPSAAAIVTYARSGSTFLGDLVRQSPNVFYVFEPIHFMKNRTEFKKFHFLNNSVSTYKTYLEAAEDVLRNILTCNFKKLPLEFWNGSFMTLNGYHLERFYRTFQIEIIRRYFEPNIFEAKLEILIAECLKVKLTIVKTIRTPIFVFKNLFGELHNMKVLHLVRDPRPTISSQNGAITKIVSVLKYARSFCVHVLNDLTTSDFLTSYFIPNRIYRIHYEDLALDPILTSQKVYQFLDLSFSTKIKSWVFNMTSSGSSDKGLLSTRRGNSSEMINKWRRYVGIRFVQDVDSQCNILYERLGYLPAINEAILRNISIPLFSKRQEKIESIVV